MQLPETYLQHMQDLLGADYPAYLESFQQPRLYGLRVNTLKISPEEFKRIAPFHLEPIPWIPNGFYYQEEDHPSRHPYYFAGLYYIQEPSAMTPASVLPVEEGDLILDMCAAPGGKSTELGAKLHHTGLLVTNDISSSRAKALLKNVEVFGIPNVCILSEDPSQLNTRYPSFFDKILIDAPCSGEGMFRKDNKLIRAWEKNGPAFYAKIQKDLLLAGADMLKPGGKMVYSTCTFSREEDEDSIRYLLDNRPDMHLCTIPEHEGFSHGFLQDENDQERHLERTVRLFPHKIRGEGHFVALLEKQSKQEEPYSICSASRPEKLPVELTDFLSHCSYPVPLSLITIRDSRVFLMPEKSCTVRGLRILRNGLLLGEVKKNRFEPSQAFAMVLEKEQYDNSISLPVSDDRVVRYLKGETLQFDDLTGVRNGWVLFCVDGFPLGWGKYNGSTLKNKYLAGWRWV